MSYSDTLKFNWPSSIKAEVQFENTNLVNQGQKSLQQIERGQYIMQADKKENRILIQIRDYEVDQLTPAVKQLEFAQQANKVSRLISELPRYWIEDDGESVNLELEDDYLSRISRNIEEMLEAYPEQARSGLKEMLEHVVSPHRIKRLVESKWNSRVRFWIDREYSQDREVEVIREVNIPTPGGDFILIGVRSRYSMLGEALCERDGQQRDCVVLQLTSEPANQSMTELEQAFLGPQAQLIDINFVSRIKVIVEPGTLVTHRFETELKIGFYDSDGLVLEQIQQGVDQYHYD
ncbi:MAG: hypothetical protein V7731_11900 [Amphritea sp.]